MATVRLVVAVLVAAFGLSTAIAQSSSSSSSSSTGAFVASGSLTFNTSFTTLPFSNRSRSACAVDADSLWVVGGFDGRIAYNDVWRLNLSSLQWTKAIGVSAPVNFGGGASGVLLAQSMLHFGGVSGLATNDVWASLDAGDSWSRTDPQAAWSGRSDFATVTLPSTNIVIIIGGVVSNSGVSNLFNASDVWMCSDGLGLNWHRQSASPPFGAIAGASAVALQDHSIVLTGGYVNGSLSSNTYISTDLGRSWQLQSSGQFPARAYHSSVVDSTGVIYIIGGTTASASEASAYVSNNRGASWIALTISPSTTPSLSYTCAALIGPSTARSIIFVGGESSASSTIIPYSVQLASLSTSLTFAGSSISAVDVSGGLVTAKPTIPVSSSSSLHNSNSSSTAIVGSSSSTGAASASSSSTGQVNDVNAASRTARHRWTTGLAAALLLLAYL